LFRQLIKDTDIFIPKIEETLNKGCSFSAYRDWPSKPIVPFKSNKVLGKPGEHDTEIHAILAEYGLPAEFPIERPCPIDTR
jgi:ribonuclease R